MAMLKTIIHFGLCLIILCLPLYLLRLKIWWVPTTVLELMIAGLFILWLIKGSPRAALAKQGCPRAALVFIFLGVTISTLFSTDIQTSAGIWKGWFITPLLFFIVFVTTIKTKEQIRNVLAALTLSGLGVAIIGIWYWLSGHLTYDGRLRAFYLSPNHLAMYLAPCLILGFGLWGFIKNKWQKILLVSCCMFQVLCLYLTYSYGAWLGLIGAAVFLAMINVFKQKKKILLYCFIALLLFVFLGSWQLQTEKAQNLLKFSRSSLESRLIVWQVAIEIIKTTPHNFLWGVGPGMFQKYYLEYQPQFKPYLEWAVPQPHNLFLAFWLQTGLLGLIGFIWLLVVFFRNNLKKNQVSCFHPADDQPKAGMFHVSGVMVYILIHGLVDTTYWKNDLAIIFWLVIGLAVVMGASDHKADHLSD